MSRLALNLFAAVCMGAMPLLAQVTPTAAPAAPAAPAPAPDPNALKWSAESIEYNAKPGEENAPFHFFVTNISQTPVVFNGLRTSCGCTVAQLPTTPYTLMPGSNIPVNATMNLAGKQGAVTKTIMADTSVGLKNLLVKVNIPAAAAATAAPGAPAMDGRAKNIQTALADRQAVFKGDCASCHVEKGKGKFGQELYAASCGICHDAEHRAAMVTDLRVPRGPRDLAFWQKWIMEGKPGTMMPAFAHSHGGPLTQEQVDSLTTYCFQNFPKGPQSASSTPTAVTPAVVVPATPSKN